MTQNIPNALSMCDFDTPLSPKGRSPEQNNKHRNIGIK